MSFFDDSNGTHFKDEQNNTPPNKKETITMREHGINDIPEVSLPIPWTNQETSQIQTALTEISKDIIKNKINSKLESLYEENKPENEMEIASLEKEITSLETKTLKDVALPLNQEYDWDEVVQKLNSTRKPIEVQALWKTHLHPSIYKKAWTNIEHQALKKIAAKFEKQDWDEIAKALNTGRSGFQCFVYYRTRVEKNILPQTIGSSYRWWNKMF